MTARSIGSAIAPNWLSAMTVGSLFISVFGLALFSAVMLGTSNVDILSILEASQGLPNLLDRIGFLTRVYENLTDWIPYLFNDIPNIPVVEFFTFVVNALLKIIELIAYIVELLPIALLTTIMIPIWFAVDTINILGSITAALSGSTFYFIDLSSLYVWLGV